MPTNADRERLRLNALRLLYPEVDIRGSMGGKQTDLPPGLAWALRPRRSRRIVTECEQPKPDSSEHNTLDHDRLPPVPTIPKRRRRSNPQVPMAVLEQWEYEDMLADQDGKCAICLRRPGPDERRLAVDHDHLTGIVRGLLCGPCNRAIGLFRDDPTRMYRAAKYVKRWRDGLDTEAIRSDLAG